MSPKREYLRMKPDRYSDAAAIVYEKVATSGLPERVIAEALRQSAIEAYEDAIMQVPGGHYCDPQDVADAIRARADEVRGNAGKEGK